MGYSEDSDGLEVTLENYEKDVDFRNIVRSECITGLVLKGQQKEAEDNKLMEEVMRDCGETKAKICFAYMLHTLPVSKLPVLPSLKKLTFYISILNSDALLRFNDWCPNLTEIHFKRGVGMSREAFETFTSIQSATYPQVITFEFDMSDDYDLTRDFLAKMDKKFPSLKCFDLTLSYDDEFSAYDPQYQVSYQPLYFKNLKKLSVSAFGNQIDKLFDYMAVSNIKLKEFKFMGMTTPSEMISWIGNCKALSKLTLACPHILEDGLMELKDMHLLREVHFEAKHIHWEPEEIVEFARNNKRLKVMNIESDRKNNSMKFDWKFKDKFDELMRERRKLKIKVVFHEGERKINVSETSFSETQLYDTPDSDDNESDSYRL
ncbi:uncharacterized protein LOC119069236 isoform X2 [Bradysia coprophila]|uniref:uncharacterized protein LOC119069236 isoform X2 n=1 Tax=Bradysia coprophila TaxID=38358 RepID=UPI00187DB9DF|nr:uncharacterized protein LOC119069236 isoform X2 [Bradysia coprophila]